MGEDLMGVEAYRFDGKRALVVGGASGMGAATAVVVRDLGAEVVVMDHVEVTTPGVKSITVEPARPRRHRHGRRRVR